MGSLAGNVTGECRYEARLCVGLPGAYRGDTGAWSSATRAQIHLKSARVVMGDLLGMEYNSSGACNSLPSGSQVEFGAVAVGL